MVHHPFRIFFGARCPSAEIVREIPGGGDDPIEVSGNGSDLQRGFHRQRMEGVGKNPQSQALLADMSGMNGGVEGHHLHLQTDLLYFVDE